MSSALVTPPRKHSAIASVAPAATVSSDSSAPSAGSNRDRNRSRSRSSARPRNIVIARWVWAFTRPGQHDRATRVDRPAGVERAVERADVGDRAAVDEHGGVVVDAALRRPS